MHPYFDKWLTITSPLVLQPILMAPIQVVELMRVPPELRTDSQVRSANTASSLPRGWKTPDPKGIINYYGYRRVGAKGTENLPWVVSY